MYETPHECQKLECLVSAVDAIVNVIREIFVFDK